MFLFYAYQRVTEDLVVGRNEELTRRAAGQLSSDLSNYAETLNGLARSVDIYSADPERQSGDHQGTDANFAIEVRRGKELLGVARVRGVARR